MELKVEGQEIMDTGFMAEAIREAEKAGAKGEVPVGAVLVHEDCVVALGRNRKETAFDPTAHAEVVAIRAAAEKLGRWRLEGSTLYVTLEPCLMCMGAIIQARIKRLVFAAFDPKAGACGSVYDVSNDKRLNHAVMVTTGVAAEEAGMVLKRFFSELRAGKLGRGSKKSQS